MILSPQEIQALLRICQSETGERPRSKTVEGLVNKLGFGRLVGKRWVVTEQDRERIRSYLQATEGIDPQTPPDAWKHKGRIEAAEIGWNEKLGGRRPRAGRVALRALGILNVNGQQLALPPRSFLDAPANEVVELHHDCVIVVENFEPFVCFEDARLNLPYTNPLLVFRGDAANPQDALLSLLAGCSLPIIAWPDLDPAGLLWCGALPFLAGVVAPTGADESLREHGRSDLYLSQLRQMDAINLRGSAQALGRYVGGTEKGLDQEKMIAKGIGLKVWRCD